MAPIINGAPTNEKERPRFHSSDVSEGLHQISFICTDPFSHRRRLSATAVVGG